MNTAWRGAGGVQTMYTHVTKSKNDKKKEYGFRNEGRLLRG
jgi:hypothetical protein